MKKKTVTTIASKNKLLVAPLTREAKAVLRRKQIDDKKLFKMLNSDDTWDLPTDSQVRMLALECLYARGFKIFNEAL